jgi:hypothetical protein
MYFVFESDLQNTRIAPQNFHARFMLTLLSRQQTAQTSPVRRNMGNTRSTMRNKHALAITETNAIL